MAWDNAIRLVNQRLNRLAKFAGRDKSVLNQLTNTIESIVNPQAIFNFYKNKYEEENRPQTVEEIKTLSKRAKNYANEKAAIKAVERRVFLDGTGIIQIIRTSKLKDFYNYIGNRLLNTIPTVGNLKKQLINAGLEPTAENANKMQDILLDFDELMDIYKTMEKNLAYQEIKSIREKSKKIRRPTYAEMDKMLSIYNNRGNYKGG